MSGFKADPEDILSRIMNNPDSSWAMDVGPRDGEVLFSIDGAIFIDQEEERYLDSLVLPDLEECINNALDNVYAPEFDTLAVTLLRRVREEIFNKDK